MIIPFCFGIIIALMVSRSPLAEDLNNYAYDVLLSMTDTGRQANRVVVVGIGDKALKRFKDPLVFWHHYLSQIITGIAEAGAKGIALDIVPAISLERLAPQLDRELIKALIQARNRGTKVFLGFKSGKNGVAPQRKFIFSASGLCSLNLNPDRDGTIRKQTLQIGSIDTEKRQVFSISHCLALLVKEDKQISDVKMPYIDYRIHPSEIIEFGDAYDWSANHRLGQLKKVFAGKLVYIGITSFQLPDNYTVPLQMSEQGVRLAGVTIHAITTEMLVQGKLLKDVDIEYQWALLAGFALFSSICSLFLSPSRAMLILAAAIVAAAFGVYQAFIAFLVFPTGSLGITLMIPGIIVGGSRYTLEYFQFRRLQRYFSSYVHPHVLKEIIEHPEYIAFEGKKAVTTVMFTDICSFTSFSENMEAECLVDGLNRYFEKMTKSVIDNGGYLNRFLGDGILAIFGAPNKLPHDGALAAVKCALDMMERLKELNRKKIFQGHDLTINIGIGIHTGEAVVGNIGCREKMDYSIMGDTVNLASRIEGQTRHYETSILISRETYDRIRDKVEARHIATTAVKGREQEVELYEVLQLLDE